MKKTIVISAVNLNHGGTLTILRDCLQFLSIFSVENNYKIVAIVFDKNLAFYPNIEYIETKWPKKRWLNRLWFEYISMKRISKKLGPVYLWFSLHDTSPYVLATNQAVYCHSPFLFYKANFKELFLTPKIFAFSLFTRYIYRTNIKSNNYIVVQQEWIRNKMSKIYNLNLSKIVVALPNSNKEILYTDSKKFNSYTFVYASSPNTHKNFEVLCEAVYILNYKRKIDNFKLSITVKGDENNYAKFLFNNWAHKCPNINFIGFLNQSELYNLYNNSDCLVFPSKIETWGLPISEFSQFNKPMLLADLPYAHETAAGAKLVCYFNPESAEELAQKMEDLITGNTSILNEQPQIKYDEPVAKDWEELFEILLKSN